MTRDQHQPTHDTPPWKGGAPLTRDQHPMTRRILAPWRTSARTWACRVFAIGLLACACLLGVGANSGHEAHAATQYAPVSSVHVDSVSPNGFSGACPVGGVAFSNAATIFFLANNPGGLVQGTWSLYRGSGGTPLQSQELGYPINGVTVPAGVASSPVSVNWAALDPAQGNGQYSVQLIVNTSGFFQSNLLSFTYTCTLSVTGVTLSASGNCSLFGPGMTYAATVSVTPSPGGSLSFSWQRVTTSNTDSFSTTGSPVSVGPDQTSLTLTLGPIRVAGVLVGHVVGTILVVTAPNMVYSNPLIELC